MFSPRFVAMGRELRTLGVTVPATDLIIASSARLAGAELLHFDGHFELIAEHLPLVTRPVGCAQFDRQGNGERCGCVDAGCCPAPYHHL